SYRAHPSSPTRRASDLSIETKINRSAWSLSPAPRIPGTSGAPYFTSLRITTGEKHTRMYWRVSVSDTTTETSSERTCAPKTPSRSEEHTSELQSRENLV